MSESFWCQHCTEGKSPSSLAAPQLKRSRTSVILPIQAREQSFFIWWHALPRRMLAWPSSISLEFAHDVGRRSVTQRVSGMRIVVFRTRTSRMGGLVEIEGPPKTHPARCFLAQLGVKAYARSAVTTRPFCTARVVRRRAMSAFGCEAV